MSIQRLFAVFCFLILNEACAAEELNLEPIQVMGNYENAVGTSDAASEGVVTSRLIANRPTLRTGELLEFVPGMIVSQHSGDGKANQYYLRGFNLDHGTDFATYVDEIPVNMRTHAHGQGYTDLNFLIPELVEKIKYKKGPYFAEEGDFASAGAAHLSLVDRLPSGIASLSLGNNGYQRAMLADSSAVSDGNLLYGLEINRNDGPWTSPEGVKKYSGLLRYSEGDKKDGFNLTAMAYHNQWNSTDQIPLRAVESGQLGRFDAIDPSDGGNTARYSLTFAKYQQDENGAFDVNAYAVYSRLDLFSNFTYFLDNATDGDQFNQSERRRMAGFNVSKSWFTNLAGFDMQNKIGLQTRYDGLKPVALYDTEQRNRTNLIRSDRVNETSEGLFAENNTLWLDKFRSVAGLRFDQYQFGVNSSIEGDSGRANANQISPKLSLILGPWAKTEYFMNYGKGFHSNDARGTTQTRLADGSVSSPVTPLVPTYGSEIGLRSEIVPGLQSSLALWRLNIASELVFVGDAGETEPSRSSHRQGVEWNNHYIANDWLLLDADFAASKARYTDNDPVGNYIPGSVDKVASFGATITNFHDWTGALQIRYFGPRPLIEDNSVRSHSTTVAYARLGYKFNPRTRLNLDIFNLFDRKASDIDYYYSSKLNSETSGVDDIHFHPVEPRSARLTLTYNF